MRIKDFNKENSENLKNIIFICLLSPICIFCQENFFYTHDYNALSQRYSNLIVYEEDIYTLGVTICSTGECGILSKYNGDGDLIFLNEIDNIDVNSSRCFTMKDNTLVLIALSKYEVGGRLQKYDLEGELLEDKLINRDTNLVYTWPLDALYEDEYIYLAVNENYENESRQTAVYKLDYTGNVLDHVRLPYHYRGGILTLTHLNNGNLFVSQRYIDEGICAFEHEDVDNLNADIFYEISLGSLDIIREKQNVCYQSTNSVSYDCTMLSNDNIVRNVLWRHPLNENIIHAANIYYNSDWEEIGIDKYPQLVVGNPLAHYGVLNNRTFASLDSNYFFVRAFISYPQPDEDFPYGNLLIQKWDIDRNMIWERVISDPNVHHRLFLTSLSETESGIVLSGYVWSDFDIAGTRDFAVMSLDLDGCFNGDCSDTIYLNGPPTAVDDASVDDEISIYPNPVLDELTVRGSSPLRSIACYALDGTLVMREDVSTMEYILDFSVLPSGMYVVRVVSDTGISTRKVMKL